MSVNYKAIGQRIKQKRKAMKKTQDNLAEALTVSVGYISQIERGATKISLDTLAEVARFLNCDLAELVTGVTPNQTRYLHEEMARIYSEMTVEQRSMLLEVAEVIVKY